MSQAYELPVFAPPLRAGEDLRLFQFRAVDIDSTGRVVAATAASRVVGFLQNKPNIDEAASVMVHGITKAVNGFAGALAAGVSVAAVGATTARGKVQTATTGQEICGVTLAACTAVNEMMPLLILFTQIV